LTVSMIVVVHNEHERIHDFLRRHAPLVDEVVFVDQASTDGTLELGVIALGDYAKSFTTLRHPCLGFSEASNPAALMACTKEWVLTLFPDEQLTPEFIGQFRDLIADPNVDGYWLQRDSWIGGRLWLGGEHCMRLVRRHCMQVVPYVHNDPICGTSRKAMLGFTCIVHDKTMEEQHADNVRYQGLKTQGGVAPVIPCAKCQNAFALGEQDSNGPVCRDCV